MQLSDVFFVIIRRLIRHYTFGLQVIFYRYRSCTTGMDADQLVTILRNKKPLRLVFDEPINSYFVSLFLRLTVSIISLKIFLENIGGPSFDNNC